jgi:hypothetical protein
MHNPGTLRRWSWLHLKSIAPTNTDWARVVGYGSFSLCVIHEGGLYPNSGDIIIHIDLVLIDQQSVGKRGLHLMNTVNAKKRWTTIY